MRADTLLKTRLTALFFAGSLGCLPTPGAAQSNDLVRLPDGREIRLNPDGTWEYTARERLITMPDGRRVQLSDDGTWTPADSDVGQVPGRTPVLPPPIQVSEFVIESVRSSRHKNLKERSQMLIRLAGAIDALKSLAPTDVMLEDSRGRHYDILSISPRDGQLLIRADDSPSWWGVKYFVLQLPGHDPLRIPMTAVIERNLKAFSE